MNFLELVRDVYKESGESFSGGATATTADSSVISYDSLVAGWVNQAWLQIQQMQKQWKWMWSEFTLDLDTVNSDYDLPTPVGTNSKIHTVKWEEPLHYYPTGDSSKYNYIYYMPYNQFADEFRHLKTGKPTSITQLPNDKIRISAIPDQNYTLSGAGWRKPWSMSNNSDIPDMPELYHKLIVYYALTDHVRWESALDIMPLVMQKRQEMLSRLMNDQLPDYIVGDTLV